MAEESAGGEARSGDWERLQRAFFSPWSGGFDPTVFAPLQGFAESFGKAAEARFSDASAAAAPWQSFKLFADLLGEQARQLRAGRKRKVDVAAAMKALLENAVRNLDVAIAAQALVAGDKAMGLAPFGLDRAFVDWPALGLTRDWQLRLQRWSQALTAAREADAHLRTLQWRALRAGCEGCGRALAAPGPAITSLRGLYDLFVDGIEAAWRETAMTDDYARAFGASVNASLALRVAARELAQPLASLLELAGRAELDAMDRRLRELEARMQAPPPRAESSRPAPRSEAPPSAAKPRAATPSKGRTRTQARAASKPAPRRGEFDIASVSGRDDAK